MRICTLLFFAASFAAAISWLSSVFINANNLRTCLSVTNPPPLQ